MKSQIDEAVLEHRTKTVHEYEYASVDGQTVMVCRRCGRLQRDLVADGINRPCRGFVG